jgi:hypothetical protein
MEENPMRTMMSLIVVAVIFGGPAALAQTTTAPNSGAGVPGAPGNKSGQAVKPGEQPSGVRPDQSKVPGMPGNKSGPAEKPSQDQKKR